MGVLRDKSGGRLVVPAFIMLSVVVAATIYFLPVPAQDNTSRGITIESAGLDLPDKLPPGMPIKYVKISAPSVYFKEAPVSVKYTDAELKGHDERSLRLYHWNGATWETLPTTIDPVNNIISAPTSSFSLFAVSALGSPQVNITTNRLVILDDPSGWDGGATGVDDVGNQWSGESTTIRWYVLVMNSSGRGGRNNLVTSRILFPNGTIALNKTNITNDVGIAAFEQDMDRWLIGNGSASEGIYTINANASVDGLAVASSYNFTYDEWGCGSSGGSCHNSAYWQGAGRPPRNISDDAGWTSGSIQNSPYLHEWDSFHVQTVHSFFLNQSECLTCHRGYDGVNRNHSSRVRTVPQYPAGIHNGKVTCTECHATFGSGTMPILQCYDCHPLKNDNLTIRNFSQTAGSGFSYQPLTNSSIIAHNAGQDIPCIQCHNGMHNVSTPYNATEASNTFTEYQQCTACHTAYERHNDSVSCTVCHSQDAHAIKVFAPDAKYVDETAGAGNCTDCHQNASFLETLLSQSRAGSHSGSAPQVPEPVHHSNDPLNGSKWNSTNPYWINTSQVSMCKYCHGETLHKTEALGRPSLFSGGNEVNSSISTSVWCQQCHWQGAFNYSGMVSVFEEDNKTIPPEISGNITYGANQTNPAYFNHSDVDKDDASCKSCHSSLAGDSITGLMHNVAIGTSGGADCISCHDTGGIAGAGRLVNFTAMNNSIHKNLNSGALTGLSAENKKCWACHGNGSEPGGSHPSNYKTPYRCPDCHVQNAGQNLNFTPSSILNVTRHYWNGTNITTKAATSCYDCHNKSEMMAGNVDPDGPASVYGGANGGNNSTSHYGIKRPDLRAWDSGNTVNCTYCHQNTSTAFESIMLDRSVNTSIFNHTDAASGPDCNNSSCHSGGWIHNSTLQKPELTIDYCGTICHTIITHNDTVFCWNCHQDPNGTMYRAPPHGMMFPQENGSFLRYEKGTPANCTTCHVYGLVNTSSDRATRIPPLNHSTDPYSGGKWGSYWDNTSMITACHYCHQAGIHVAVPIGNVSFIKGSNTLNNADLVNSTWCANCHYSVSPQYNGSNLMPRPPEITDPGLNSSDGTPFFNHTGFAYNDSVCKGCHGGALSGYSETSLNFSHRVGEGGGGPDCVSCHDVNGTGAPQNKRIIKSAMEQGVHVNLNSNTTNSTAIDPVNKACWACHGNGSEPVGHPENYKNPRECSNNDCHSLAQSFKAPMLYSHFRDAGLNGNPANVTNFNLSANVSCETCHSISMTAESGNLSASVSHYAFRKDLIDSINCIYCHLDKDNAEKWGNATEINKNRTSLVEMDRLKNKFTAHAGDFLDLGTGYRLKVLDISIKRGSAAMELYKDDTLVDSSLVNIGEYVYEENRTVNYSLFKTPVIILNITEMFISDNGSFLQFEGFRLKRSHFENKTTSCYLCHFSGYEKKHKYTIIEKRDEYLYYTEVLFNTSDKKEYDQDAALQILANKTPNDSSADIERARRKMLRQGETWELAPNFRLTLEDVSSNSESVVFLLEAGGESQTDITGKDKTLSFELSINYLGYTYSNVTIFKANVSEILQPDLVVLEDITALSPDIKKIKDNTSIYGYNTSWLRENNTFLTGRIPESFHAPLLQEGRDGGADCRACHAVGNLGAHESLNSKAASNIASKACWACHGDGQEPKHHPANYRNPRKCASCHTERIVPFFNATYIGDEKHGILENCAACHVVDTHEIIHFNVTPGIRDLTISAKQVFAGEMVVINATATAGYEMRIRGAEYYIDSPQNKYPMSAVDGSFDEQSEKLTAAINTSFLKPGTHTIYVRAMERGNKWGQEVAITFEVKELSAKDSEARSRSLLVLTIFLLLVIFKIKRLNLN